MPDNGIILGSVRANAGLPKPGPSRTARDALLRQLKPLKSTLRTGRHMDGAERETPEQEEGLGNGSRKLRL